MTTHRPTSITVSSILNFIVGGLGILFALTGIVSSSAMMSNPVNAMANNLPPEIAQMTGAIGLFIGFLSLAVGGAAIVSGVGLVRMAQWGRGWTLGYAIAGISIAVIGFLLMVLIGGVTLEKLQGTNPTEAQKAFSTIVVAAAVMAVVKCIYPVVLLFLLRSAKWKEAFAINSTESA